MVRIPPQGFRKTSEFGRSIAEAKLRAYSSTLVCEWSASRPGPFTPKERAPGTHRMRGWVGRRAGLDDMK
jgi:hypothetical protein